MPQSLAFLFLLSVAAYGFAADTMLAPVKAKTTAEIIAAAEKEDVAGGLRKDPDVTWIESRSGEQKIFVAWYNPYSGIAACHAYVYAFDKESGVWVRKIAKRFDGTPYLSVSVEIGSTIKIRDWKDKEIQQYPEK